MTTSTSAPATGQKGVQQRRGAKKAADADASEPLTLPQIRASIPAECFVKSPAMSLYYMARDLGMFAAMLGGVWYAMQTPQWAAAAPAAQYSVLLAYWMANGLVMWTCFVVGHDCGHGSFSDSWWLNAICGHFLHAPLLVPFFNWAESHRRHHQYHNHYERDYSFPWFTPDDLKAANRSVSHGIRVTFPFTGFAMYLAGLPDGGHWLPFGGRLWQSASVRRYTRGTISALSVAAWAWFVGALAGWDAATAFKLYGGCWLFFSFWLVTVTYLQHHDEDTIVYDQDWTFLRGAFQTIDRECTLLLQASTQCAACLAAQPSNLTLPQCPPLYPQTATASMSSTTTSPTATWCTTCSSPPSRTTTSPRPRRPCVTSWRSAAC